MDVLLLDAEGQKQHLEVNLPRHEVRLGGQRLSLTPQEYALLVTLLASPQVTVSRQELLQQAWGYRSPGATRTVDVHVQRLRRKLSPGCIQTVYRQGYRFCTAG